DVDSRIPSVAVALSISLPRSSHNVSSRGILSSRWTNRRNVGMAHLHNENGTAQDADFGVVNGSVDPERSGPTDTPWRKNGCQTGPRNIRRAPRGRCRCLAYAGISRSAWLNSRVGLAVAPVRILARREECQRPREDAGAPGLAHPRVARERGRCPAIAAW